MHPYEKWNSSEIQVANIGLGLAAAAGDTEILRLRTAVTYWLEQAFLYKEGMNQNRFPTTEEMKRFSIKKSQQQQSNELSELEANEDRSKSSGKGLKRKRGSYAAHTFHCDPTKNKKYFLVFPLTEAMINEKKTPKYFVIANHALKAYKTVFGWKVNNNNLRTGMIAQLQNNDGKKPDRWTIKSTWVVNP
jgi:hypothetical protein